MALLTREQLYASNGLKKTKAIFRGMSEDVGEHLLTLGEDKGDGVIALKPLFLAYCVKDPTEYVFAEVVFGDMPYWEHIKNLSWVRPHYEEWKLICDVERKSIAFQAILNEIETDGRSAFTAAKYLIEEPWVPKKGPDARKNRARVRESAEKAFEQSGLQDDVARLKEEGFLN